MIQGRIRWVAQSIAAAARVIVRRCVGRDLGRVLDEGAVAACREPVDAVSGAAEDAGRASSGGRR